MPSSTALRSSPSLPTPFQQSKMSITQTYFLAHTARGKLSREAQRPDHNLRLLVGHANMLDNLMLDLADAEAEQDRWLNQTLKETVEEKPVVSVTPAPAPSSPARHIQWAESAIVDEEEDEEDWDNESDSDSDAYSDYDEDEEQEFALLVRGRSAPRVISTPKSAPTTSFTLVQPKAIITTHEILPEEEDDSASDMDSDDEELSLTRTSSHATMTPLSSTVTSPTSPTSPPQLCEDASSDSEEDEDTLLMMPPSPTQSEMDPFAAAQHNNNNNTTSVITLVSQEEDKTSSDPNFFHHHGFGFMSEQPAPISAF